MIIATCFISGCVDDITVVESIDIIVDANGDGNYTSIREAVENAEEGDVILVKSGTYTENVRIDTTLKIIGEDKENTIVNFKESGYYYIFFVNTDGCTIENLTIINTNTNASKEIYGINLNSDNNIVTNNIVQKCRWGIYVKDSRKNNQILNNNCDLNEDGIHLLYGQDNLISNNVVTDSSENGIYANTGSHNNTFSYNTISNGSGYGIRLRGSEDCQVYNNILKNNGIGAYMCCGAKNNHIYNNIFRDNNKKNALDAVNNKWDNGNIGNYWDDYDGLDEDGDGIGDSLYYIFAKEDGSISNVGGVIKDNYPLMEPPFDE